MDGLIVLNKEKEYTSRDVDNIVSKELQVKKIGHAGTLDPLATGVLVLAVNQGTKILEFLVNKEKEYIAEVKCGIKTDTLDITGKVLEEQKDYVLSVKKVKQVLDTFKGKYMQEVPKYSAVKVNGKKLYEYARRQEEVELPKKEVNIKKIELLSIKEDGFTFKTTVSKGTYIRSLIRDIGDKLEIACTMSNLVRTKEDAFSIDQAYTIEDIKKKHYQIVSLKEALSTYQQISVEGALYFKIKNGNQLKDLWNIKEICVFLYQEQVVGIYKKEGDYLRAKKIFSKPID